MIWGAIWGSMADADMDRRQQRVLTAARGPAGRDLGGARLAAAAAWARQHLQSSALWHTLVIPHTTTQHTPHTHQVGNFRVEPPSLFRGRGEHPKMGKVKKRVYPRDITINIGERLV